MLWHEKGLQQEDARKDGIKSHEEDGTQTWRQILIIVSLVSLQKTYNIWKNDSQK